ncbi:MAG: hypothetical protein ACYDEX_22065 [Mobilitalea sp.]
MYYEQPKKNYYRFPSTNSINDFDSKHYFPEKTHASNEDSRYEAQYSNHVDHKESYFDLK